MRGLRDILSKTYGFGLMEQVFTAALYILSYRVLLSVYGAERYGIFIVACSIAALISFLELGATGTMHKFGASFYKEGDLSSAARLLDSMVRYKLGLFCIVAGLFLLVNVFPQIFFKREVLMDTGAMRDIRMLLSIATGVACINYFSGVYIGLASAFFLLDKLAVARVIMSVILIACLLGLDSGVLSFPITVYYLILACMGLLPFLVSLFYAKRILKGIRSSFRKTKFSDVLERQIRDFRNVSYLGSLGTALLMRTDEIIISKFLALAFLPVFIIGKRAYEQLSSLNKMFAEPLNNLSVIYSDKSTKKYISIGTVTYSLLSFVFSGLVLLSSGIICRNIFKNSDPQTVKILGLFCLAFQFNVIGMVINRFLYINGFHRPLTYAPLVTAVVKLAVLILFIEKAGLILIPMIIFAQTVALHIVRFYLLVRNKIVGFHEAFGIYFRSFMIPAVILGISYALIRVVMRGISLNPFINLLSNSVIFVLIFTAVSFLMTTVEEKKTLKNLLFAAG